MTRVVALLLAVAVGAPAVLPGQQYRVRIDARAQAVSFRGLEEDSILASLALPSESGGFETPDGHAVRCGSSMYCFYFRPGEELRAIPVSATASAILWGFGVPGLTARASGRVLADAGSAEVWPGTEPAVQLLEGYLEYDRQRILARAGRQLLASRLEPIGFDGAWLRFRWHEAALELTGYGGWGLARASALPVTSSALNPLDEWRPRDRQIVAGAEAAWMYRAIDLRAEYRREIDPQDDYFVSERTGLSLGARFAPLRFAAGFDYNVAEGHFGSADAALTYVHDRFTVSGGARRYRPYFSLWTLWSAFSPVPYNAVHLSGQVRATDRLSLHWRAERYRYEDAAVSTALVPQLEDRGWRAHAGASASVHRQWRIEGTVGMEHGPGASSRYADGAVSFIPNERLAIDVYGGTMDRPLELRFYDASSNWIGGRASWQFRAQHRVWADAAFVDDERDRPDASASSLSQVRLRSGITLSFGSDADRTPLPPARPTMR